MHIKKTKQLCSEIVNHRFSRPLAHFIFGLLCGGALYFIALEDLGFEKEFTLSVTFFISMLLAAGNVFSTYVRCTCLLTVPSFCGKTGRGILKTMALALVIAGPFSNIMLNIKEVVRVFGCTTQLTYNLTMAKYNLMVEPFQEALLNLRHDDRQIAETLESIDEVIEPIITEVEGEEEVDNLRAENDYIDTVEGDSLRSKEIERKYKYLRETKRSTGNGSQEDALFFEMEYKRKVEYRCEGVVSTGSSRCRDLFQGAYDKCYEAVSALAAWLLCWPMKLTFVCNLVSALGGDAMCNADEVVEPGFGQGYSSLKNTKSALADSLGDVKIKYSMKGIQKIDMKVITETAHASFQQFKRTKTFYDTVTLIIQRCLAVVVLIVIYKAIRYQDKYLSDIYFDNNYITHYFKRIDQRRQQFGRRYLLPLKKTERKYFLDPYSVLPTRKECLRIVKQSLLLILEMFPASTFFILDFALYEILFIISRHAEVEFTQKGSHDITINVIGDGVVANLVRSLAEGFNVKRIIHVVHSNATCLPKPSSLYTYFILKTYGLYFAVWLLIALDGYFVRLHRSICAFYYPKREKRRILFLYNESLKRRIVYNKNILSKILRRAREAELERKTNILLSLRLRKPKFFGWLRFFSVAKLECLICGERELWKMDLIECTTLDCHSIYCRQCWSELNKVCHVCKDWWIEDEDEEGGYNNGKVEEDESLSSEEEEYIE